MNRGERESLWREEAGEREARGRGKVKMAGTDGLVSRQKERTREVGRMEGPDRTSVSIPEPGWKRGSSNQTCPDPTRPDPIH